MAKPPRLDRRQRRLPRQAPGVRLPVRRDLRRHPVGLGLRPARRRAQGEHQAPVVASMVQPRDDIVGLDSSRDPAAPDLGGLAATSRPSPTRSTECQSCHKRFRADHLQEEYAGEEGHRRPRRRRPRRRSPAPTAAPAARGPSRASSPGCSRPTSAWSRTSPACTTCAPRPRRASSSTSPTW